MIRDTVPLPEFETQAEPKPHSTSYGAVPTRTVAVTLPVRVSMRVALPVMFATAHTAPGAVARLKTRAPTFTRETTLPLSGSMRSTSPIASPPAQIEPPPAASPYVHSPASTFSVGAAASAASNVAAISFTAASVVAAPPWSDC